MVNDGFLALWMVLGIVIIFMIHDYWWYSKVASGVISSVAGKSAAVIDRSGSRFALVFSSQWYQRCAKGKGIMNHEKMMKNWTSNQDFPTQMTANWRKQLMRWPLKSSRNMYIYIYIFVYTYNYLYIYIFIFIFIFIYIYTLW